MKDELYTEFLNNTDEVVNALRTTRMPQAKGELFEVLRGIDMAPQTFEVCAMCAQGVVLEALGFKVESVDDSLEMIRDDFSFGADEGISLHEMPSIRFSDLCEEDQTRLRKALPGYLFGYLDYVSLYNVNDTGDFTFSEIADLVEQSWTKQREELERENETK